MARTPRTALRGVVAGVKVGVVVAVAAMAVSPSITQTAADRVPAPSGPIAADTAGQARLDRLMARYDCSATGFGPDVIPGSALVEVDDRVQHVSFDEGWAIYTGDVSGSLLAVCTTSV